MKRIDKIGGGITKTISYNIQVIERARFLASSLLNLVDNLAKGTHKTKCKHGHENKLCEMCGIKYKDCECCLEYINVKDDYTEVRAAIIITKGSLMKT